MGSDMTATSATRPRVVGAGPVIAPFAAWAAFGVFWGAWGAALPTLRTQAGASESQLGTALLFVGVGAIPAMAITGRAVDRYGLRVAAWLLTALAGAGLLITAATGGVLLLTVGMLVVGAASGATDVAIATVAGRAEHVTDKPLLARSAGVFSVGVVISSLSIGALLGAGLSLLGAFVVVAVLMCALAATAALTSSILDVPAHADAGTRDDAGTRGAGDRRTSGTGTSTPSSAREPAGLLRRINPASPLVVVGLVAALAYAVENAHQSWGAVMLTDVFEASPQLAAAAPATFAGAAALARLCLAPLSRSRPTAMLLGGGAVATVGSTVLAAAPSVTIALLGLVLAALGTATLFPTLLSRSLRGVDPAQHGRATSVVAATAYLGFLLGPAYVGLLAGHADLRIALLGVAALGLVFTLASAPISNWAARRAHSAP